MAEQKTILEARYEWAKISAENRQRIRNKEKILETADIDEANAIESQGEYYLDRFSDSRQKFLLVRRERR